MMDERRRRQGGVREPSCLRDRQLYPSRAEEEVTAAAAAVLPPRSSVSNFVGSFGRLGMKGVEGRRGSRETSRNCLHRP